MERTPLVTAPIRWVERSPVDVLDVKIRRFTADVADGDLVVLVGREPIGPIDPASPRKDQRTIQWHLSISHSTRYPTWDEVADARERWLPDEITFGMILPPKSEYVNLHNTTFHLHELPGA